MMRWVLSLVVAFHWSSPASAQVPPKFDASASVDIVSVPVTVTSSAGRFVFGLTRDDFDIRDDGQRRMLTQFSAERVPVSLGILLDISGSMAQDPKGRAADDARWADTRRALELLVSKLDPRDEVLFAVFNEKVALASAWTRIMADCCAHSTRHPGGQHRVLRCGAVDSTGVPSGATLEEGAARNF